MRNFSSSIEIQPAKEFLLANDFKSTNDAIKIDHMIQGKASEESGNKETKPS